MSDSYPPQALPLCLPDNCTWDEKTREYKRHKEKPRRRLYTVSYTLSRLRAIPGPVCVVSIAGPCRQGKSYIISKVFDQGDVFPLGHLMDPETMGVWVWIVPRKYVDSLGREFTLVLLDSEGTDAVTSEQVHDHSIFTLTVLFSSILIYNSRGVPTRSDLNNLDHIGKLSQRIQVMSSKSSSKTMPSQKRALPLFIWLLRDVVLRLPPGCSSYREYLLEEIFTSDNQNTGGVAQEILQFFSGFDAFQLPPPSDNPDVLSNIHDATSDLKPAFVKGVQKFKKILERHLEPKKGFHDKELVTGEALALLVEEYVKTLNQPDAVPCVERAWNTFVDQKYSLAVSEAQQLYRSDMEQEFRGKLPCEDEMIRNKHQEALSECLQLIDSHVTGIVQDIDGKYINTFVAFAERMESEWLIENNKETEKHCQNLLKDLRIEILPRVLERLDGTDGAMVSYEEINGAYDEVVVEFHRRCKGSNALSRNYAAIFRIQALDELQSDYQRLQLKKDYETSIQTEKEARKRQQKEIQHLKEESEVRRTVRKELDKRMKELIKKAEEETKRRMELHSQRMDAQKAEMEARNAKFCADREKQRKSMADRRQNLESSIRDLDRAMKERDREIAELKSKLK